ncbi:MAG: hypothetical protein WCI74_16045 [Actinomycetes bacterium]
MRISLVFLVHVKGWQGTLHPSMNQRIAVITALTNVDAPRRMACRVMMSKNTSTQWSQNPEVEVKRRWWLRGFKTGRMTGAVMR